MCSACLCRKKLCLKNYRKRPQRIIYRYVASCSALPIKHVKTKQKNNKKKNDYVNLVIVRRWNRDQNLINRPAPPGVTYLLTHTHKQRHMNQIMQLTSMLIMLLFMYFVNQLFLDVIWISDFWCKHRWRRLRFRCLHAKVHWMMIKLSGSLDLIVLLLGEGGHQDIRVSTLTLSTLSWDL